RAAGAVPGSACTLAGDGRLSALVAHRASLSRVAPSQPVPRGRCPVQLAPLARALSILLPACSLRAERLATRRGRLAPLRRAYRGRSAAGGEGASAGLCRQYLARGRRAPVRRRPQF